MKKRVAFICLLGVSAQLMAVKEKRMYRGYPPRHETLRGQNKSMAERLFERYKPQPQKHKNNRAK